MLSNKTILIIGHVFPEPRSSAAGTRMLQLINFFLNEKMQVVFACDAVRSEFGVLPDNGLLRVEKIQVNDSSFDELLIELNPEMVLFDRFMTEEKYGWRVTENIPDAMQILDMEDFHALRKIRELNSGYLINPDISAFQHEFAYREIASMLRCDLNLVISLAEMELLTELFNLPESILFYLPFWHDTESETDEIIPFENRSDFVCIGNFMHPPNLDSVIWLKDEIWPLIRQKLPTAILRIYGAGQNQKQHDWHDEKSGFLMLGRAEDAIEVLSASKVSLAPLRFGAGLKGKLLDSMIAGTPSVTTPIGAEGMHNNLPWPGAVAETANQIADAAVRLYSDSDLWNKASVNGNPILKNCFSKSKNTSTFKTHLIGQLSNLNNVRQHNFYRGLLNSTSYKATKYMSRWIELKNNPRIHL
ncbi:MAG: glycosyltransferase family 4 protein [Bacteroidetes bacterium]|nr:glycosyltransferase family 4 protein [Bacteroidota bacterium]